ncbi:MAG: PAS domain S-box protein [Proteobacteria bacterium]|nr:PAS domain S-box protein [Pseudomonadota bacterium]
MGTFLEGGGRRQRRPWLTLPAAALIVGAALGLRLWLNPWLAGAQFITFFPAVVLVTFFFGTVAGLFAVALCVGAGWMILSGGGGLTLPEANSLVIFTGVALMDVGIISALLAANSARRETLGRVGQLNRDLSQSETKFRDLLEATPDAMVIVDHTGRIALINRQTERLFGYSRDELLGEPVERLTPEPLRSRHADLVADFMASPRARRMASDRELRGRRKDGSEIPVEVSLSYLGQGDQRLGLSAIRDISDWKAAAERQDLLIHELNHRVKNVLASVQSIAQQTLHTADSPEAFNTAFMARLMALSRSHDVLTREDWTGTSLRELAGEQTQAYETSDHERVRLDGPDVHISPRMALTLGMVLGELATNAAKHGALSDDGGVDIIWTVEARADGPWLSLAWREHGGPPVAAPTRRGFGSTLIERAVRHELAGSSRLSFAPDGLVCTLAFPLSESRR